MLAREHQAAVKPPSTLICVPVINRPAVGDVAVEFRDDTGDTAYAPKNIRKDAHGRYWLNSWNRQFTDVPLVPDQIFPFARYNCKVGESG